MTVETTHHLVNAVFVPSGEAISQVADRFMEGKP
jgi:hypothetical protein